MRRIITAICVTLCILLTACGSAEDKALTNEIYGKLQPENGAEVSSDIAKNAANIEKNTDGDYAYWKSKKLNYTNQVFWDMIDNDGSGCKLGEFIYYTQMIDPTELELPIGQPIDEYMLDISTEQNVLWNMSGYQLNEWYPVNGTTVMYKLYDCSLFNTKAMDGRNWTFMVHRYIIAQDNDESNARTYFNILGLTEFNGEWLTMELTGNYNENDTELADYKAIVTEFAKIYGFEETFEAKSDVCAEYFIGRIV